ncbi:MAG: hypothetical protein R3178_04565, partial [Rhodothermales bacterium]|nr:hypothetical protein [Rhodothermales bacterium]
MRTASLIILTLFVGLPVRSQPVAGSWEMLTSAPDAGGVRLRHDDTFFLNASIGWVANLRGEVWRTDDGGGEWNLIFDNGGAVGLRSIGFATEDVGWSGTVLNPGSVLFETRDGGQSWTEISNRIVGPVPTGICGIHVLDETVAFGAGVFHGDPHIIRTANGGTTWESHDVSDLAGSLVDIHFISPSTGFAVGGTGSDLDGDAVILRTLDGGDTWSRVHVTTRSPEVVGEWGWKISFPSETVGYVSVEYAASSAPQPAKVLATRDGGGSWAPLSIPGSTETAGLQGIGFVTEDVG